MRLKNKKCWYFLLKLEFIIQFFKLIMLLYGYDQKEKI
ncbi:hypothetical protein SMU61_05125 [Streptococcus mutans G123]|nr:hypothetical protein SMU61_05125 [Streptococcus mutans G123]